MPVRRCFELEVLAMLSPGKLLSTCLIGRKWTAICCISATLFDTCSVLINTVVTSHQKYFLWDPMFHFLLFNRKGLSLKNMQIFFLEAECLESISSSTKWLHGIGHIIFPLGLDDQFEEGWFFLLSANDRLKVRLKEEQKRLAWRINWFIYWKVWRQGCFRLGWIQVFHQH